MWPAYYGAPHNVYVLAKETAVSSILNTNFFGIVYFVDKTENRFFYKIFAPLLRPFLEFKRSVQFVQKGNPTLVT